MKSVFTRRGFVTATLTGLLGVSGLALRPLWLHEATCPVCKLDVVQDTEKLDNEVALKFGRKRIEYRCVYCALSDAKNFNGDLTILAPSRLKESRSFSPRRRAVEGRPGDCRLCRSRR